MEARVRYGEFRHQTVCLVSFARQHPAGAVATLSACKTWDHHRSCCDGALERRARIPCLAGRAGCYEHPLVGANPPRPHASSRSPVVHRRPKAVPPLRPAIVACRPGENQKAALAAINTFAPHSGGKRGCHLGTSVGTERSSVRASADLPEGRKAGSSLRAHQSLPRGSAAPARRGGHAPGAVQRMHPGNRGSPAGAPRLAPAGPVRRPVPEQLTGAEPGAPLVRRSPASLPDRVGCAKPQLLASRKRIVSA